MTNHEIKKPTLFISHATSDAEFANSVKYEIEKVFANGISIFCSSSPGDIAIGRDWLHEIESKLDTAQAVIAIVTPVSIERPWLWFEIGATWSKGRKEECRIYPLCAPEINLSELHPPLNRLQALSIGKTQDLKMLFEALVAQFGFGNVSTFRAANITRRIPKYKDVKVKEVDLNDYSFYSGRYTGYDDEELMEVLDTEVLLPDQEEKENYPLARNGREDLIHNGKLLHFKQIDKELDLPHGTAKRLLPVVAERYGLKAQYENNNVIRFALTGRRR